MGRISLLPIWLVTLPENSDSSIRYMKPMTAKPKRSSSRRTRSTRPKTGKKTASRKARSSTVRTRKTPAHRKSSSASSGVTYVFECTRQGCGYQIVREEKADAGKLRFDLKCPKCHNREFKCLGPGDLTTPEEALGLTLPAPEIDIGSVNPLDLGSN
jgi:hypothetical protein